MQPHFQDELHRIDRLLALVGARSLTPVGGTIAYHDLLIITCGSLAGFGHWLESDRAFLPRDAGELRCDIQREPSISTCASIAAGRTALVLAPPAVRGGIAGSPRRQASRDGSETFVQYYVDDSDPADPYGGAEIDVVFADCRSAWQRIVDRHWLSGLFCR